MSKLNKILAQASETIANMAGYIRVFQGNKTRITNRELNHILERCQQATAQIGEALTQIPPLTHNDLLSFLEWLCAHGTDISGYEDFDFTSGNKLGPYEQIVTNYLGDPQESKE